MVNYFKFDVSTNLYEYRREARGEAGANAQAKANAEAARASSSKPTHPAAVAPEMSAEQKAAEAKKAFAEEVKKAYAELVKSGTPANEAAAKAVQQVQQRRASQ